MDNFYMLGYAEYNGVIYPFSRTIGEMIFLMDIVGKKGFNTIVKRISDVRIIKHPNTDLGRIEWNL